jgi:NADH-quinone oxidoreductase subunit N
MSMVVGTFLSFAQPSVKKFIASSSVGQVGFALIVPSIFIDVAELKYAISYMFAYLLSSICLFVGLYGVSSPNQFTDMAGKIKTHQIHLYALLAGFFSIIGMPPFIGFIAKLNIFILLIEHERYTLAIVAIVYVVLTMSYTATALKHIFAPKEPMFEIRAKSIKSGTIASIAIATLILGNVFLSEIDICAEKVAKSFISK